MPPNKMSRRDVLNYMRAIAVYPIARHLIPGDEAQLPQLVPRRSAAAQPVLTLVNPRLAHPIFVEPGGECNIEVETTAWLDPARWSVLLSTDLGAAWSCQVVDTSDQGIDYGRRAGWRLRVKVPSDITPELMILRVSHLDAAGPLEEARAVSVVPSLWTDGYLLHLTDEHVMFDSVKHYACENPRSGYRSADLVRWATPVVNVLNPRLVINSGDQAHQYATTGYRYTYNEDIYRCYLTAKRGYRVPSMMVLGNHEVHEKDAAQRARDWARWEGLAGRRYYHIRLGSLWIFAHDYLDPASKAFIEERYPASFSGGDVDGRIIVQHHTSAYGYRPSERYAPTAMLIGHLHSQRVESRWPYPILMSAAAHNYATASMIRIARRNDRWTTNATDDWARCGLRLVGDNGDPNIAVTYAQPNDGSARANRVTITNKLVQGFNDGRIRLVLADGRYAVRGGNVLHRYRIAGGKAVVLVQIDVAARDGLELEVTAQTSTLADMSTALEPADPPQIVEPANAANNAPLDSRDGELAPLDPGATRDAELLTPQVYLPLVR
ncbi:MAG: hypothetical protein OHK0015_45200 [Chloroflexi bacterium OHK40]